MNYIYLVRNGDGIDSAWSDEESAKARCAQVQQWFPQNAVRVESHVRFDSKCLLF